MVILASKDIKLAASARKSGDIDEDSEADSQPSTAAAFTSAATAKVLSQVRRGVIPAFSFGTSNLIAVATHQLDVYRRHWLPKRAR